ncbi:hypothetical protein Kpol_534p10 [Vanderwaltozyma polyspora DSM 70294]|uniref:GOLD domain-containing protein n=1 Tax=Vanderwaltozyma polyspora (strain ATCC 22028 / DSM 70294 / BCRC 21397 / CBS 2163 / NBRC 10782 / NRRL Y-8283 / UCD 57-17) TaxID=436907 RepID=A7TJI8_VANPO|nr:uncharacterized protein Kpol_534p10 [Vanderwaltozyma polyspora DSM 70294]EDO17531.1 hypothetical protein Kpol_534p10 [Vanderwaltozyma polyspora DSM 70294]
MKHSYFILDITILLVLLCSIKASCEDGQDTRNIIKKGLSSGILNFKLLPFKKSIDSLTSYQMGDPIDDSIFCIDFKIDDTRISPSVIHIKVTDHLPFKFSRRLFDENLDSYSCKQNLEMMIRAKKENSIIRYCNSLPTGNNFIQFNSPKTAEYQICFRNIIRDFSWTRRNFEKLISIEITDRYNYLNRNYRELEENVIPRTKKAITQSISDIFDINTQSSEYNFRHLLKLEEERRNLNELTYTGLLFIVITLIISTICINSLIVILVSRNSNSPKYV